MAASEAMSRAKSRSSNGANIVNREVESAATEATETAEAAAAFGRSWYWRSEVLMALVKSV